VVGLLVGWFGGVVGWFVGGVLGLVEQRMVGWLDI